MASKITIAEKNVASLSDIKNGLTKEIESLKETTASMSNEVSRLVETSNNKDKEIETLSKNSKLLHEQTDELNAKIVTIEKVNQDNTEKLNHDHDGQVVELNKNIKQLQKDLETA